MKRNLLNPLFGFLPFLLLLVNVTSRAQTAPDWNPNLT